MAEEEPKDSELDKTPPERDDESSGTSDEIEEEKPSGREEEKPESPETSKEKGKPEEEEESEAELKARYTKSTQELAESRKQIEFLKQEILRRQPPPPTQPKTRLDDVIEKHKLDGDVIRDVVGAMTDTWQQQQRDHDTRILQSQIDTMKEVQWKDFREKYPDFPEEKRAELDSEMNKIAMDNPKLLDTGNAYAKVLRYKYAEDPNAFRGIIQAAEKRAEERAKKRETSKLTKLGKEPKTSEKEKKSEEQEAMDELFGKPPREFE